MLFRGDDETCVVQSETEKLARFAQGWYAKRLHWEADDAPMGSEAPIGPPAPDPVSEPPVDAPKRRGRPPKGAV